MAKIAGMAAKKFFCIVILFAINLLNYMDRYTIAGILSDVMRFYQIDDQMTGFLQTVFIVFLMLFAPICGFLGDRFNRKRIILAGELVWVGAMIASSFVPAEHFWAFILLRGVIGIGEASYAVIAPTMIADMFTGKMRSRIMMFFYFAIPVGSGLGYVIGSAVTSIAKQGDMHCIDCWQWGLRATPIIGLITLVLLAIGVDEPVRGEAEFDEGAVADDPAGTANEAQQIQIDADDGTSSNRAPYEATELLTSAVENDANIWHHLRTAKSDLVYLAQNRTFIWSTIAYTAVVFVTGTLTWWSTVAIEEAMAWHQNFTNTSQLPNKSEIPFTFGVITCIGGLIGVTLGSVVAMLWKHGRCLFATCATPMADPLVCSIGSFVAAPLLFLGLKTIEWDMMTAAWTILFLTIVMLSLNWAINVDMLMSIIVPHRRSMACAVQILLSHAFGDASGPWIVGAISDWVGGQDKSPETHFNSLMLSFYLPNALLLLSGTAFLVSAFTLPHSLRQMEEWQGRTKPDEQQREDKEEESGEQEEEESGQAHPDQQSHRGIQNEAFE